MCNFPQHQHRLTFQNACVVLCVVMQVLEMKEIEDAKPAASSSGKQFSRQDV